MPTPKLRPLSYGDFAASVGGFLEEAMELRRQYDVDNDPWWADTLRMAPDVAEALTRQHTNTVIAELWRMGIVVEVDEAVPAGSIQVLRCNKPLPRRPPIW